MKNPLTIHIEIYYYGSFIKYIHIHKELPYNGYAETVPHTPCQHRKPSVPRIYYILLNCWPVGHIAIVGIHSYASELDVKSLLLKIPHT